jgi:alcohol dehydrogenase
MTSTALLTPPPTSATVDDRFTAEVGGIRLVFGDGTLGEVGEEARRLGGRRALVVADPGIVAAGYADAARDALGRAGVEAALFDGVAENPSTDDVARGTEAARRHDADVLVAVGGGSSLDCAKGVNFLLTQGGKMEDYWGDGKATRPMLPSIGVPTTAGTGSEAQRFALVSRAESHRKMACGDVKARFKTVFLDPELLRSVPRKVAAAAGIDAVSHAVESFVTKTRNPVSRLYAAEAWRLLDGSLETFLDDPADAAARRRMLLGSHLAGAAIEVSMLGAAHALANPLTARYGVVHGAAVGLTLPHVVRFNAAEIQDLYTGLAHDVEALARRLEELYLKTALPTRLGDWGVDAAALPTLAAEADEQWTARHNPRPVTAGDLLKLYESAL